MLGGRKLVVEAKGETSSSETTSRYGAPFSGKQVFSHVSKAVLKAVRAYSQGAEPGMAFPETRLHHKEVALIEPALAALGVTVFWVDRDRTVTECDYRVAKSYEA